MYRAINSDPLIGTHLPWPITSMANEESHPTVFEDPPNIPWLRSWSRWSIDIWGTIGYRAWLVTSCDLALTKPRKAKSLQSRSAKCPSQSQGLGWELSWTTEISSEKNMLKFTISSNHSCFRRAIMTSYVDEPSSSTRHDDRHGPH